MFMKKEYLRKKLEILKKEINQSKSIVDDYTQLYLCNLEELVTKYLNCIDNDLMKASNGDTLGFRRAILEYDDLAEIESLYCAACDVDNYYSIECREWHE